MVLISSIICMALVYYFMDSGLAIGFIAALCLEIFSLITLYNVLKNTEHKAAKSYEKIINDYREREKKNEAIIEKLNKRQAELNSQAVENKDSSEQKDNVENSTSDSDPESNKADQTDVKE